MKMLEALEAVIAYFGWAKHPECANAKGCIICVVKSAALSGAASGEATPRKLMARSGVGELHFEDAICVDWNCVHVGNVFPLAATPAVVEPPKCPKCSSTSKGTRLNVYSEASRNGEDPCNSHWHDTVSPPPAQTSNGCVVAPKEDFRPAEPTRTVEPPCADCGRSEYVHSSLDHRFVASAEPTRREIINNLAKKEYAEGSYSPEPPTPPEICSYCLQTRIPIDVRLTIERERTKVCDAVNAIKKELHSRDWLREGRGSYEWDDDRWMAEFGHAVEGIKEALSPLEKIAGDLSNCPVNSAEVKQARQGLAAAAPLLDVPPMDFIQYVAIGNRVVDNIHPVSSKQDTLAVCRHNHEAEKVVEHLNRARSIDVQSVARALREGLEEFNFWHPDHYEHAEKKLATILSRELGEKNDE